MASGERRWKMPLNRTEQLQIIRYIKVYKVNSAPTLFFA